MAKRLHGTIFFNLLQLRRAPDKTNIAAPARALSTTQRIPEPCDLFEYTTGRWMYVAGQQPFHVELFD